MAFDITSVLKNVSNSDTTEQIVYLSLDLIDPDPENFYNMDGVEELAANIELLGLQQPLRVEPKGNGRYTVISGHRRRVACIMLADGYGGERNKRFERVPCIVESGQVSEAMRKLRLIYANANTRVMTPWELSEQAGQVEKLLYELKEEGYDFPGRMRDHVAAACQTNAAKLGRLKVIREKLQPEALRAEFAAGHLSEAAAYEIARREPEIQEAFLREYRPESVRTMTAEFVKQHLDMAEELQSRRQTREQEPEPKAATAAPAPQISDADAYIEKRHEEDDAFFEMLTEGKNWFLQELNALNSRQDGIERLKGRFGKSFYNISHGKLCVSCSPKDMELFRPGKMKRIARTWTEVYDMLCTIALNDAFLNLVGRASKPVSKTDTIREWSTGDPKEDGSYLVVAGYPEEEMDGLTWKTVLRRSGQSWVKEKTDAPFDMNVYRWYQLPED